MTPTSLTDDVALLAVVVGLAALAFLLVHVTRETVRTLTPALTHVEPELTTDAAEAAVAEATTLIDEPVTLAFKGEDVGSLPPERLVKLLRFRPRRCRRSSPSPPARRSRRRRR